MEGNTVAGSCVRCKGILPDTTTIARKVHKCDRRPTPLDHNKSSHQRGLVTPRTLGGIRVFNTRTTYKSSDRQQRQPLALYANEHTHTHKHAHTRTSAETPASPPISDMAAPKACTPSTGTALPLSFSAAASASSPSATVRPSFVSRLAAWGSYIRTDCCNTPIRIKGKSQIIQPKANAKAYRRRGTRPEQRGEKRGRRAGDTRTTFQWWEIQGAPYHTYQLVEWGLGESMRCAVRLGDAKVGDRVCAYR